MDWIVLPQCSFDWEVDGYYGYCVKENPAGEGIEQIDSDPDTDFDYGKDRSKHTDATDVHSPRRRIYCIFRM